MTAWKADRLHKCDHVHGDTVAFVYEMYLTPKGMENAPTFTMMATEFNHFKMVGKKLIVTRLDLYTDGRKMN